MIANRMMKRRFAVACGVQVRPPLRGFGIQRLKNRAIFPMKAFHWPPSQRSQ